MGLAGSPANQPAFADTGAANNASTTSNAKFPFPLIGRIVFSQTDPSLFEYDFPALNFQNASLFEVLTKLAQMSNTNVVAGWPALARAGIDSKSQLSFNLPAQDYRHELAGVLSEYAPKVFLVVSADQNVIFINTRDADDQQLVVKDYWLEDLTANLPQIIQAGANLQAIGTASTTQPAQIIAKLPKQADMMGIISSMVRPEIWVNHGGKATIVESEQHVIVTAPLNVQAILDGPKTYNPDAAPRYLMYSQ